MNGTNENKVDCIIAELRSFGDRPPPRFAWNRIADELEAAVKEEREVLREAATSKMLEGATIIYNRWHGNAAAMRDALKYVIQFDASEDAAMDDGLTDAERIMEYADHIEESQKKAISALAKPPRNCDVGSADEQLRRWRKFCEKFHYCVDCPADKKDGISADCFANWSQMSYEEGESKSATQP